MRIDRVDAAGNTENAPALYLRADDGTPTPITPGTTITPEQFGRIIWDASKNDGGSFTFTPLGADGQPLQGVAAQTIPIYESAPVPNYDGTRDGLTAAWNGTLSLPSGVLAGNDDNRAPAFVRIGAITPKDPDTASRAALWLDADGDGPGAAVPVTEGQEIAATDFGKLHWDAGGNAGGTFQFTPLDGNRKAILGASPQTVTVGEAPQAPDYDAQATARHDAQHLLDATLLAGNSPDRQPDAVRLLDYTETPAGRQKGSADSPLYLLRDGQKEYLRSDALIRAEDFDKVHWDASANGGGSFRFMPVDAQGNTVPGWTEQTITVQETPAPVLPEYPADPFIQAVRHDASVTFAQTVFAGTKPSKAPAGGVRIGRIEARDNPGNEAPLYLREETDSLSPIASGQIIKPDQFSRIVWDASKNGGGSFTFTPLNADGEPLQGVNPQTITVYESAPPPAYNGLMVGVTAPWDGTLTLQSGIFEGSDSTRAPAFVRITRIRPTGQGATKTPALWLEAEGDDPGDATPITDGQDIAAADFGRLFWDASANTGGTFRFTPLDASRKPILGASSQTVRVSEAPQMPDYEAQAVAGAEHDTQHHLDASFFGGTSAARQPGAVRLESYTETAEGSQTGGTPSALYLLRDGHREYLTPTSLIRAEDFDKVYWDASANAGGEFRIMPVDAQGNEVPGWTTHSVTVHEYPVPPTYPDPQPKQAVAHDGRLALPESLLTGTVPEHKPAMVQIMAIDPMDAADETSPALLRTVDGVTTPVKLGEIIPASQFGSLHWDASHGEGGSFTFTAMDSKHYSLPNVPLQTITIVEDVAIPDYPGTESMHLAGHDQTVAFDRETFAGTDARKAPAKIKITTLQVDGGVGTSPAALMLDPDGPGGQPAHALAQGETIDAADFGKLSWNTAGNDGGTFTFQPMDASGKAIDGATPQTVVVHESPTPPTYPADMTARVQHDGTVDFQGEYSRLMTGTDTTKWPGHIRIDSINPTSPTGSVPTLTLASGSGTRTIQNGAVLTIEEAQRLTWHADANDGGTLTFTALDNASRPIVDANGAEVQKTITIEEGRVHPDYTKDSLQVDRATSTQIDRTVLEGDKPDHAPAAIRIDSLLGRMGGSSDPQPLYVLRNGQKDYLHQGSIVQSADFDKLYWDGSRSFGGTFTFTALDDRGRPILGLDPQEISLKEKPVAPVYSTPPAVQDVVHDGTIDLPASIFHGTGGTNTRPYYVKITAISPTGGTGGLMYDADGATGAAAPRPVSVNDTFRLDQLDKLSWNASNNEGGSFTFRALDAYGTKIQGSPAQTVRVHELPAPPVYSSAADRQHVPFAQVLRIGADHAEFINGSDAARAPAKIRITNLVQPHDLDQSHSPLQLSSDGTVKPGNTQLSKGSIVEQADFDKLIWDASKTDGGSFTFEVLDAQGNPVHTAQGQKVTHTVNIDEHAVAGGSGTNISVAHQTITWLTPNAFSAPPSGTLRYFKVTSEIEASEGPTGERYVWWQSPQGRNAYEFVEARGMSVEQMHKHAASLGGKVMSIDDAAERQWLGTQRISLNNFGDGNYFFIDKQGQHKPGHSSGYIIEFENYRPPLHLQDEAYSDGRRDIWHGTILSTDEVQRLAWDSRASSWGTATLREVEGPSVRGPTDTEDNHKNTDLPGNRFIGDPITLNFREVPEGKHPEGVWATTAQSGSKVGIRQVATTDASDRQDTAAHGDTLTLESMLTSPSAPALPPAAAQVLGPGAAGSMEPATATGISPATASALNIWHGTSPLDDLLLHPSLT